MADPYEEDLPEMFDPLEVKCSECKEDLTLDTRLLVDGKVLCVQCTEKEISRDDPGYMSDCNQTALRALLHRLRFIQQSGDESLLQETNKRFNKLLGDCYYEICTEYVDFEKKTDSILDETGSRIPRDLLLELAESVGLTESEGVSTIRAQLVGGIVKCYLVKYLKYLESQQHLDPIYRDSEDIAWMHFKSEEFVEDINEDPLFLLRDTGYEDLVKILDMTQNLEQKLKIRLTEEKEEENLEEKEEGNLEEEEGKDGEQIEEMIDYYGIPIRHQDLEPLELLREEWYADDTDNFIEDLELVRQRGGSLGEWARRGLVLQTELAEWEENQADEGELEEELEEELDDDFSVASTISYDEYDRRQRAGDFDQLEIDPVE